MKSKEVKLQCKSVYGKVRIYPVNEVASHLLLLTGRQTFNNQDIDVIRAMGFEVIYVPMEPTGREVE